MVAIVVMLALSIGMGILADSSDQPETVHADVTFENHDDDAVTVHWTNRGTAEQLLVTNGTETKYIDTFNENVTMAPGRDGEDIEVWALKKGQRSYVSKYSVPNYQTGLYLESSTCDDVDEDGDGTIDSYCGSTIHYNGTEIWTERGVTIIVLQPDGTFYSHAWYATHNQSQYRPPTYSLAADGTPDMQAKQSCSDCVNPRVVNHLSNVPDNYHVILVGSGQPGRDSNYPSGSAGSGINENVEQEYEALGGRFSGDDVLEYRDSWILVSENGDRRVFERHAPRGDQSGVAEVTAYFFAGREGE